MSFRPIKVTTIRKTFGGYKKQEERVTNIIHYYADALKEDSEFMRCSAIENIIYEYRRGFLDDDWYWIAVDSMDDVDDLER